MAPTYVSDSTTDTDNISNVTQIEVPDNRRPNNNDQTSSPLSLSTTQSTVQLDFSSIFDSNVIKQDSNDPAAFDRDGAYITQNVADAYWGQGLPNNGYFPAQSDIHPEVDFNWSDPLNDAWKVSEPGNVTANVQDGKFNEVHVYAATAQDRHESADFKVGFVYEDGTTSYSKTFTALDWYLDSGEDGWPNDPDGYYLTNNNDRWNLKDDLYESVNEVAIFGFGIQIDSTKTLQEVIIDVEAKGNTNVFGFFGGVATTDTTSTADDSVGPAIQFNSPSNTTTSKSVTIEAEIKDAITTVSSAYVTIDDTTSFTLSQNGDLWSTNYDFATDGIHTIEVVATDANGNTNSEMMEFVIDQSAPSITINSPVNQTYSQSPLEIDVDVTDYSQLDQVIAEIDGVKNISLSDSGSTYTGIAELTDGSHSIKIYANDSYGYNSNTSTSIFTIDTNYPNLTIENPTASIYNSGLQTITVSTSDITSDIDQVIAEINGTTNVTLTKSGDKYTYDYSFSEGNQTVKVYATDSAGLTTTSQVSFTVDETGPEVTINNPTNMTYTESTQTVEVNASDSYTNISSVVAELNGASNTSLTLDNGVYTMDRSFSDGTHTLKVYVTDKAGNVETVSVTFSIDTANPSVHIDSPESTTYTSNELTIEATVNDTTSPVDTVLVEIDSSNYTMNPSNGIYTFTSTFADGQHEITVYANDTNGWINSRSVSFTVDTKVPNITINSPQSQIYLTNPSLNITVFDETSAIDTALVEIDGKNYTMTFSVGDFIYDHIFADGEHTISFYANDSNNHFSSQSVTFTVDQSGPSISVNSPNTMTYTSSPSLDITVTDKDSSVDTVLVEIGGTNYTMLKSGDEYTLDQMFVEGQHTITFYANDSNNHFSSQSVTFTVDQSGPSISVNSPNTTTYTFSPALDITVDDEFSSVDTVLVEIDGINYTMALSDGDFIYDHLFADGKHTISFYANDTNNHFSSQSVTFTVDMVGPNVVVNSPEVKTYTKSPSIDITVTDKDSSVDTVVVEIDGVNHTMVKSGNDYTFDHSFEEGDHIIIFFANDTNGLTSKQPVIFTVDQSSPSIVMNSPESKTYTSSPAIEITVTDKDSLVDTVLVEIDGANHTMIKSGDDYTFDQSFDEGEQTIIFYANDTNGHTTKQSVTFTVDKSAPSVTIQSPDSLNYATADLTIEAIVIDSLSTIDLVTLEVDGSDNITMNYQGDDLYLVNQSFADGTHNLRLIAYDSNGLYTIVSVSFVVDTTGPQLSLLTPMEQTYGYAEIDINATTSDATGTIQSVVAQIGTNNISLTNVDGIYTTSYSFTEGRHELIIIAIDDQGNSNMTKITFTVDLSAPVISDINPANVNYTTSNIDLNATVTDSTSDIVSVVAEIDGQTNVSLIDDGVYTTNYTFSEGHHKVKFIVTDASGHVITKSVTFTVDISDPVIENISISDIIYTQNELDINATVEDATSKVDTVLLEVDGTYNLTLINKGTLYLTSYNFTEGSHTIRFIANDSMGHYAIEEVSFVVDISTPGIQLNSLDQIHYMVNEVALNVSVYDNTSAIDSVIVIIDDNVTLYLNGSNGIYVDIYNFDEGHHTVEFIATDTAGWSYSISVSFVIDTIKPQVSILSPTSTTYNFSTVQVNYTISEISKVTISLNGSLNTTIMNSGFILNDLAVGLYNLTIIAEDYTGNVNYNSVLFEVSSPADQTDTFNENNEGPAEVEPQIKPIYGLLGFAIISMVVGIRSAVRQN